MTEHEACISDPYESICENTAPPELCPVCGRQYDTAYADKFGDIFACDNCVKRVHVLL